MLSIIISAYACSPDMGSEPGMAWNWCINLAKYHHLHIITEGEDKDKIDAVLPTLPQRENMIFYYNPVSDRIRQMCSNQGDWRFYIHYKRWQEKTYQMALKICKNNQIDIIHQLNMIGFREPGYLWKINNIPFVWGPVGGMNLYPKEYMNNLTLKEKVIVKIKNRINKFQIRYKLRVRKAVKRADCFISAIPEVKSFIGNIYKKESVLICETGCNTVAEVAQANTERFKDEKSFQILWVGRFFYAKQLSLALHVIERIKSLHGLSFHIVGYGTEKQQDYYHNLAKKLNIDHLCHWHGEIPNKDVHKIMLSSQLFLFTSVSEATSTVVLEALQNNLPVVCFDACGFGAVIDDSVGCKVRLSTPEQSVLDFSVTIEHLYHERNLLVEKSMNTLFKIKEYSWDNKAAQIEKLYRQMYTEYLGRKH